MTKASVLNITPSWISQSRSEEFSDIDLVDSLQNYFMQLKGAFALLSDNLDEQGNEIAAGFALRCEGQVTEAEKLLSYWYRTKLDNADDKHSPDDLAELTPGANKIQSRDSSADTQEAYNALIQIKAVADTLVLSESEGSYLDGTIEQIGNLIINRVNTCLKEANLG